MENNEMQQNNESIENENPAANQAQPSEAPKPEASAAAAHQPSAEDPRHRAGYNPYAQGDEPSVHQNGYQQNGGYAPNGYAGTVGRQSPYGQGGYAGNSEPYTSPEFSHYQNPPSSYTQIPRETVYINNQTEQPRKKKEKAPKGRIGAGTVALIVAICMIFSGGAAFAGTYFANSLNGRGASSGGMESGEPSVIFKSYTEGNKEPGTYEQVADAVTPTVVEITTESIATSSTFWGGNYVTSGAGSGVIISADGTIVTNAHVVSGANTIRVKLKDGTSYEATLVGIDADSDIAVIKVDAKDLPFALTGDSDKLTVGEEVVAVGNPLGELGGTVTNGIVSALSRAINISGSEMTLIQTNAAVNPGNSGGGLFNMYGELIGIVNAKSTSTSSGLSVEGIGFAIPINTATKVASELMNYGYVRGKVMLGINYVDISNSFDAMMYGVNAFGMYISKDYEGFKSGDRVTAIDGKEINYSADLKSALKDYKVGDEITIKVVRKGQYVDVKITLKEYVPEPLPENQTDSSNFVNNFNSNKNS